MILIIGSILSFSVNDGCGTFILVVLSVLNKLLSTSSSSNFLRLIDLEELLLSGTAFCNIVFENDVRLGLVVTASIIAGLLVSVTAVGSVKQNLI